MNTTIVFVGVGAAFALLNVAWATYALFKIRPSRRERRNLFGVIGSNGFVLALAIYTLFPFLARDWAVEKSLETANAFMTYLNQGDIPSAEKLIKDGPIMVTSELHASLEDPVNQPVSWNLKITGGHAPDYVATGTVILPDNREIPVNVYVDWVWETALWKIRGVRYDPYGNASYENGIRFLLGSTDKSLIIKSLAFLASIVVMVASIKFLFAPGQ
ncbi:MAG: hypothetical protein AB1750_00865 [Chloroflexota bacterium]